MHLSVPKFIRAHYSLISTYLVPAFGIWIIFSVWMLFKSHETSYQESASIVSKISSEILYDNLTYNSNQSQSASKLKVMTWNLQGLKRDLLNERTNAVIEVVEKESPDIIFFQELINFSYNKLSTSLKGSYSNVVGTEESREANYFTGIFFRSSIFTLESQKVIPFHNAIMDRTQLVISLSLLRPKKLLLALLTSHLMYHPRFKEERLNQLKQCFKTCESFSDRYNVIFGGDLNLEENEEDGIVPRNMKDLWIESGSQEINKYTWDSTQNNNDDTTDNTQQPRVRYDRLYFRSSSPPTLKFEKFELHGKQIVKGTPYFPSDHWAVVSTFRVL